MTKPVEVKDTNGLEESSEIKAQELWEQATTEEEILSVGFKLIKVVETMNVSFSGLIMNTYFNCLITTTATLYTSSTVLFTREVKALILSACTFSIACLMSSRLIWLTYCGHDLSKSMKKCARHLDRLKLTEKGDDWDDIQLLKQDLRYCSESPLTPVSAFSLSTSTLLGAYGTIVTYLIVLLQFKVSENSMDTFEERNMTNTSQSIQ